jgi:DNA replication and repair protein RecF
MLPSPQNTALFLSNPDYAILLSTRSPPLYVSKLKVYNFRNLIDQTISLSRGAVYVTGLNGNGKTNLVEALYLLSGSRSFRTNTTGELFKWGHKESSVFGTVVHKTGTDELGISFSPGQRTAYKNGAAMDSVAGLVEACSVVAFSPTDLSLVKGSPSNRRKFLDRHMVDVQPSFLNTLMAYQRALASKAALLKSPGVDLAQLRPWNELLTEYGGKVVENRRNFLQSLCEKARHFHGEFAASDGELKLDLESECLGDDGSVCLDRIAAGFERAASRELAMRTTAYGPHRDDVAISLHGVDCRAYASQGQTRSVVLALKLGVIDLLEERLGETPIIILDDVDSELDSARSERLFGALLKKERQIIVTGTSTPPAPLGGSQELQVLKVDTGVILT